MSVVQGWYVDREPKLRGLGSGYVAPISPGVFVVAEYSPHDEVLFEDVVPIDTPYSGYFGGTYAIGASVAAGDLVTYDYYEMRPVDGATYPLGYIVSQSTFIVPLITPNSYVFAGIFGTPNWDTTLGRAGHPITSGTGYITESLESEALLDITALDTYAAVHDLTTHTDPIPNRDSGGTIFDYEVDYTQVNSYVTWHTKTVLINMGIVTSARAFINETFTLNNGSHGVSVHLRCYNGGSFFVDSSQTVQNSGGTLLWEHTVTAPWDFHSALEICRFNAAGLL